MKIIDFYADWCGPCKAMAPVIERLKAEGIPIEKVNVDENRDLASQYGIRSIPTIILFEDGNIKLKQTGAMSKTQFETFLS
jgi:thioredoxin 1